MSSDNRVQITITAQNLADPAFQAVVAELKGVGTAATAATAQVQKAASAQSQAGSAAASAGGGFASMNANIQKSLQAFAGFSVAGVAAGFAVKKVTGEIAGMVTAAANDAASVSRLEQAVNNAADGGWKRYAASINEVVKQGQNFAFSDDDTRGTLAFLEAQTGNTADAMHRLVVAEDLARGANIDLATSGRLLGKINDDSVAALTRLGVRLGANVTAQEALNAVEAKFGGQAGTFAESDAGKMAILKDRVGELEESLGYKLLPTVITATTELTKFVDVLSGRSGALPTTVTNGSFTYTVNYDNTSKSNAAQVLDFAKKYVQFVPQVYEVEHIAPKVLEVGKGVGQGLFGPSADDVDKLMHTYDALYSTLGQLNQIAPSLDNSLQGITGAEIYAAARAEEMTKKAKAQADQLIELDHAYTKVGQTLEQQHGVGRGGGMGESNEVRAASESWKAYGAATADAAAQVILTDNAVNKLLNSQNLLSAAYQVGLHDQAAFTGQASEYGGEIDNIQKGLDVWKRKLDAGEISQDEYNKHLDAGTHAIERYKGGQDDAITTAADYAIANETLMEAQDKIHQQYPDLIAGSEAYTQKLKDAYIAAGGTAEQFDQLNSDSGGLNAAIAGPGGLTEAVLALIQSLKDSDIHPKPTVDVKITGKDDLDHIHDTLIALDGQSYASQYTLDIGFKGGAGLPGVPTIDSTKGGGNDNTGADSGQYGAPPDDSGRGPQRSIQSYTPKDPLPPLIPAPDDTLVSPGDVAAASGAAQNAAQYAQFIKDLNQSLADAAAEMGDGVDSAKKYADLSKTSLDVMSAAIALNKELGNTEFQYGDAQARNVQALKQITEKSVQSLSDSAALFSGDGLDATKKYADTSQSALGVMSAALGFSVAMGDTVVLYGDWQARNEANLKFIAEKATTSIADSANTMDTGYLAGVKDYSDAANASLSTLTAALAFTKALADGTDISVVDLQRVGANAATLSAVSLIAAQQFKRSADTMGSEVDPSVSLLAGYVSDTTGALKNTLDLLQSFKDDTGAAALNIHEVGREAQQLAADARLMSDSFLTAAAGMSTADPVVAALASQTADATSAMKNTLDLTQAFAADTTSGSVNIRRIAREAQQLGADARVMSDAFQRAADGVGDAASEPISALATNVAAATGALKNTLDLEVEFAKQTDAAHLSAADIAAKAGILAGDSRIMADAFLAASKGYDTEVDPALTALGTSVGSATSALSSTLGLLDKLDAYKPPSPAKLASFAQELAADSVLFVQDLQAASKGMNGDAVTAAGEWADGAGKVISMFGSTADTMDKIANVSKISAKQTQIFKSNFQIVLDLIRQLNQDAQPYAADAAAFKDLIQIIAADMQAAASAIQTLAPGGSAAGGLSGTGVSLRGGGGSGSGASSNPQDQTYQVSGTGGGYLPGIQVFVDSEPVAVRVMGNMARQVPHPVVRSG